METITYRTGEGEANVVKKEIPLIKVSAANYNNETRPVIAAHRKLLCMNMKQPNVLRVLNRQGKYTDTTVKAAVVRQLSSSEVCPSRPVMFYAVGGKEMAILSPATLASGEMNVTLVEASLDEEVFATTPGEAGSVYVLGSNSVFEVKEDSGKRERKMALTAKTAVKYPAFDYHSKAQLLLVPAKNQHLDLMSTKTGRSVLTKVWEPHTDAVPTFAHFFAVHDFDEEEKENILLVTAARHNTELRFWSFNRTTQRFNLKQEITVVDQDAADDEFDISLTPSEEYITLASRKRAFAVVIEMHRSKLMAFRVTTWKTPAASLCCTTYVGKVAESAQSKSVNYELFVTLRTADSITQSMLDANKLVGGTNLASISSNAHSPASAAAAAGGGGGGSGGGNSIANWFPGAAAADGPAGTGGAPAVGGSAGVTAVSSSLLGDIKSANAIPATTAARVVQAQAQKFCEQVRRLDTDFVAAQKHATETMRLLQDPKFREEAQSNGRRFAIRNRQRLQQQQQQGLSAEGPAEPGMMTESQRELVLGLDNFFKEVKGGSEAASSAALKELLQKQLSISVEKASAGMAQLDITGSVGMNINSTDAARQFKDTVDASAREMLLSVREFLKLTRATLDTSTAETNAAVQRVRDFTNAVRDASAQLRGDLGEVKATLALMEAAGAAAGGSVGAVSPDVLVDRAVAKATAGDWAGAFGVALEASDITVLLAFLESRVCLDSEKVVTSPDTLSLPHFLSLCLQLTYELNAQPGAAPLRIQQLHRFYVEWDDTLRNLKKDPKHAGTFATASRELTTVLHCLIDMDPANLDRRTRNNFRLVNKLLVALLSAE